jgi:hypothetical protein
MKKTMKLEEPANLVEEEEEEYPGLVYNMWINATTINFNVAEGGTLIFQTGRPKDDPKP